MQVPKWGNSLAIRVPAGVARELGLKEGDDVQMRAAADGALEIAIEQDWQEALEAIRKLARPFPADFKFVREEANAR